MARVEIDLNAQTVSSATGRVSAGAGLTLNVYIRAADGTNGAAATLFTTPNLGTTTTNPLTSDSSGRFNAWVAQGPHNLVLSGAGITTTTTAWDAAPGNLDANYVTSTILSSDASVDGNRAVGTNHLKANAVTLAKLNADVTTDYGYAYSTLKHIATRSGQVVAATGAGTYVLLEGVAPVLATAATAGLSVFHVDPADYAAGSRVTTGKVKLTLLTNAAAPGITFTAGLYPVTASAGGNGVNSITLGAVVTSSTAAIATPALSTLSNAVSADFTVPAAGYYALGVVTSGSTAANSTVALHASYRVKQV